MSDGWNEYKIFYSHSGPHENDIGFRPNTFLLISIV